MNGDGWGPDGEYPEWAYDPPEWCGRCKRVVPDETGSYAVLHLGPGDVVEWTFCDDCTDSFTAWRLSADAPAAGDGDRGWPAEDS